MEKKRKAKWQNDYIAKAYDRIQIVVPKGRKNDIENYVKGRNESINGLVNDLLRHVLNMTDEEWKGSPSFLSDEDNADKP